MLELKKTSPQVAPAGGQAQSCGRLREEWFEVALGEEGGGPVGSLSSSDFRD